MNTPTVSDEDKTVADAISGCFVGGTAVLAVDAITSALGIPHDMPVAVLRALLAEPNTPVKRFEHVNRELEPYAAGFNDALDAVQRAEHNTPTPDPPQVSVGGFNEWMLSGAVPVGALRRVAAAARLLHPLVPGFWWSSPPNQATADVLEGIALVDRALVGIFPPEWDVTTPNPESSPQ